MLMILVLDARADDIEWEGRKFEARNVTAEVVTLDGEKVLRVERDLDALEFDIDNLTETVDEPTYVRLKDYVVADGIFEVKVLARVKQPTPFSSSQGFIGMAFRVAEDDSAFESIYLRPNTGRSASQFARNHTVQYFAYPDFKFNRLRDEAPGLYETWADIGMDEWITMRIHVEGRQTVMHLNDARYPSFIVGELKGGSAAGSVGFFVDIGTVGYFKDFKVISERHPETNRP